ncbi:MAG: P1 family peptidase [Clostridia bacterium]|nr:P1 family peptidase [Clostridia bacterium]
MKLQEINILDIENIKLGHATNKEAATGVTTVICERGAKVGACIFGGGPANRDFSMADPLTATQVIHAVVLGGGSAFGLDAGGGVQEYLEKKGIGLDVGVTRVPLVSEINLFDLTVGKYDVRPDHQMGYEAAANAYEEKTEFPVGNVGVGTGASHGKAYGIDRAMKSGFGTYAVQIGELKVGAIVAVNCFGDVFDIDDGHQISGLLNPEKNGLDNSEWALYQTVVKDTNLFVGNTSIGAVITNGDFTKDEMNKISRMAHGGYVRTIRPVNTTADGDSVFALSVGDVVANLDMVGTIASYVMGKAVNNAVLSAESEYGLIAAKDL